MTHIERLGNNIKIQIKPDENGYLGRECPSPECKGYFKILPGTGLQGVTDGYCPYCGYSGNYKTFYTVDQLEYAKSMAIRQIKGALIKDLKEMEFETKPRGPFGIGISMKLEPGPPHPIHYYRERELETHITCSNCSLKYAVYGIFAFCPDCGMHNSLQILKENLALIKKMITLSGSTDPEVTQKLVENALEDCVSSFDGFGRKLCSINSSKSKFPERVHKINFQSLESAKESVKSHFGFEMDQGLTTEEWQNANISFQKRHLIAHKMGIIDEDYKRRTGDSSAIVGRKIVIYSSDVESLIPVIQKMAEFMITSLNDLEAP